MSQILALLPMNAGHVQFVSDAVALSVSFAMIASFAGVSLSTRALPLVQTLPLEKRAVWALLAARGTAIAVMFPGVAVLVLAISPVGATAHAFIATATMGTGLGLAVFSVVLASYLSLRTAGGARWLRWTLWGAFLFFALAPPLAFFLTRDGSFSVALTGPGFLAAQLARAVANLGVVGVGVAMVALVGGGWLLAHAPPGARATAPLDDSDGEGIRLPWPEDTHEAPRPVSFPVMEMMSFEEQRAGQVRFLEASRGRAAAQDDPEFEPLPVPFGLDPALRYHAGARPVELNDVLIGAVSLGLLAMFVYLLFAVPYNLPPVPVIGRPDPMSLLAGLWGVTVVIVAVANAPGIRAYFRAQAKAEKQKEKKDKRAKKPKDRPRPWASSIRQWQIMQTLPIDRSLMARIYFANRLRGLAVLALLSFVPFLLFQPPPWLAGWLLLIIVASLAAVAGAAVPMLADTPVTREGERLWLWLRRTGQTMWLVGGLLVPVFVLSRVGDPLFSLQPSPGQAALYALMACLAAALPLLFYRTSYEELVMAQRPYEEPPRVLLTAATGAGMVVLLVALIAGI